MSENSKYNGWTNWETWDCNLHVFDGWEFDSKDVEGIKQEIQAYLDERYNSIEDRWIASIFWCYIQRVDIQKLAKIYATEDSEDAEN
jgi:hypothetical protein